MKAARYGIKDTLVEAPLSVMVSASSAETIANDYVFALIGGTSPNAFLKKIGIDIVAKEVSTTEQKIPA